MIYIYIYNDVMFDLCFICDDNDICCFVMNGDVEIL